MGQAQRRQFGVLESRPTVIGEVPGLPWSEQRASGTALSLFSRAGVPPAGGPKRAEPTRNARTNSRRGVGRARSRSATSASRRHACRTWMPAARPGIEWHEHNEDPPKAHPPTKIDQY